MKLWSGLKSRFEEFRRQFFEAECPDFCKNHAEHSEFFVTLHGIILNFPEEVAFSKNRFNLLNSVLHDSFGNSRDGETKRRLILILCSCGFFDGKFNSNPEKSFHHIADILEHEKTNEMISRIKKRGGAEFLYSYKFPVLKESIKKMKLHGFDEETLSLLCAGNFFFGNTERMRSEIAGLLRTSLPGDMLEFIQSENRARRIALARKTLVKVRNLAVHKKNLLRRKLLELRQSVIEAAIEAAARTKALILRKKKISIAVSSIFVCFSVFMVFFVRNEKFIPEPRSIEVENDFGLIDFGSTETNERIRQRSGSDAVIRIEHFENESRKQQTAEFLESKLREEMKRSAFDEPFFTRRAKILFMEKSLADSGIKNIGFEGKHALDKKEGE